VTNKHYKNKNQSNSASSRKQEKELNTTGNITQQGTMLSTQTSKIIQRERRKQILIEEFTLVTDTHAH
jgi:hypothetical protein